MLRRMQFLDELDEAGLMSKEVYRQLDELDEFEKAIDK